MDVKVNFTVFSVPLLSLGFDPLEEESADGFFITEPLGKPLFIYIYMFIFISIFCIVYPFFSWFPKTHTIECSR